MAHGNFGYLRVGDELFFNRTLLPFLECDMYRSELQTEIDILIANPNAVVANTIVFHQLRFGFALMC